MQLVPLPRTIPVDWSGNNPAIGENSEKELEGDPVQAQEVESKEPTVYFGVV